MRTCHERRGSLPARRAPYHRLVSAHGQPSVRVVFIDPQGAPHAVAGRPGLTLMECAIENDIPGIIAFCGGMCSCGTCHCYIDPQWRQRLAAPDDNELDTLRRVLERRPESRLGCQIRLDAALDGLTVQVPDRQRTP